MCITGCEESEWTEDVCPFCGRVEINCVCLDLDDTPDKYKGGEEL